MPSKNLEKEVAYKKHPSILIKWFSILLMLIPLVSVGQKSAEKKENFKYEKARGYNGPTDWNGDYPPSMRESKPIQLQVNPPGGNLSTDHIEDLRDYQDEEYGEGGDLPLDPEVKESDPIDLPDIDAPEVDAPDIDLPNVEAPTVSPNFWKVLLIVILSLLLIFIIYLILKNRKPIDKKLKMPPSDLEWNPEVITKTELELRLEKALSEKNYREGVRIYFTFILKELIRKNWIFWKNEKTNYDYILEMMGKPSINEFRESVRIYDLVWYGEYEINEAVFKQIEPKLNNYYQNLAKE